MSGQVTHDDPVSLFLLLVVSFVTSVAVVALTRKLCQRLRFVDRPNPNTRNRGGAALGGGVAVVFVFVSIMLVAFEGHELNSRFVPTIVAVCILGLIDDLFRLRPLYKVIGQALSASLYLIQLSPGVGVAGVVVLFLVLSSNAWNVVDVMDSLLGFIGIVCLLGVSAAFMLHGQVASRLLGISLITAGALAGFLVWNWHPAKIIMGDSGSLSLGMLYGMLVVESFSLSPLLAVSILLPGLIPYLEVGFLIVQRSRKGIPFYATTPDHFALRLIHNGYTVYHVVTWVAVAGVGLGLVASLLVFTKFHFTVAISSAIVLSVAMLFAYRFFDRLRVRQSPQ